MPEVKCSVANCEYWVQGNNCNASTIMIEVDKHANLGYDTEFAADFVDHKDKASNVANTCCHTFEPKKSK
ncbi:MULTISPECIES: DUF1540 domain-containing protein [unclassified Paenibacillus]|uniref:DUF1540 domain-containing protein n=1 Tax=unclassified Paenibacillus TaxID=185978 RepID=UPI001AE6715A|nr:MULTISPECIES: DUF1540 domain-containing protein [unclassified Paenibacillus]MBP1156311.1 hypothetical protein [Paenibacillus sp. PvP091]MBP1168303.1 hypothetical protein [Paenibacillus sp. PvR098]MBP2439331.1 hypothetical protein [Paenibacillus sp. PvP052]